MEQIKTFFRTEICFLVIFTMFSNFLCCDIEVQITNGAIKGQILQSRAGRTYCSYTGIPYAKPPVEELRFKSPQPADPWTGILDTTKEPNKFVQDGEVNGQEDCLYLNVYSPKVGEEKKKPLPVMFWIHGGAFMSGDGGPNRFGPEYFMDKDVVLVSINYRLGVLGFLSTEDNVIPGNFGMKDQVAALRWVRENVAEFNGDPDRVTVFGESSGSASAGFHLLSPTSKGLFHKVVLQSGSPICNWAILPPGLAQKRAHAVVTIAECNRQGSEDVLKCLRKVPAHLLSDIQNQFFAWLHYPIVRFGPVVENCDSGIEDAFLCNHPIYDFKQESFVPVIVGLNSAEGAVFVTSHYNCTSLVHPEIQTDFNRLLSFMLQYDHYVRPEDVDEIGERVFKEYFPPGHHLDESSFTHIVDIFSDACFIHCVVDMAKRLESPVYSYLYDHRNEFSDNWLCQKHLGVNHGDELISLFGSRLRGKNALNTRDLEISKLLVDIWCKFASSE